MSVFLLFLWSVNISGGKSNRTVSPALHEQERSSEHTNQAGQHRSSFY